MDNEPVVVWKRYTLENQFSTIDPEKLWQLCWPQGAADWHTAPEWEQMYAGPQRVMHADQ